MGLLLRNLLWAVLLPGMITVYLPWRYFGLREARIDAANPVHLAALLLIVAGTALLVACILEFMTRGRGTLSPLDPPRELVVTGLYRYVRNPMYLGAGTMLAGELLLVRSRGLALMAGAWFLLVNLFVLAYEEPHLRRVFGASYDAYTARVRRWIPRLRPYRA